MKKIFALTFAILICFTMIGCNKNPTTNSNYSDNESGIIVEEIITETVVSDTESNVESTTSENVVSNNSSQAQTSQPIQSQPTPPEETKNVIPEGGTYTCTSKGIVLTAGQEWPKTCEEYDIYIYGDYKYEYNKRIVVGMHRENGEEVNEYENINGWCVAVLDNTKAVYGEILNSVNGQPIVSLGPSSMSYEGTFFSCYNLVISPKIPDTVVNMYSTFRGCKSLVKTPEIPNSVKYLQATFLNCFSLVEVSNIPNSVTNMQSAFSDCFSLTGTITINANPSKYDYCFNNVDMSKITLTGDATKETLNNLGATGQNYTPIP